MMFDCSEKRISKKIKKTKNNSETKDKINFQKKNGMKERIDRKGRIVADEIFWWGGLPVEELIKMKKCEQKPFFIWGAPTMYGKGQGQEQVVQGGEMG